MRACQRRLGCLGRQARGLLWPITAASGLLLLTALSSFTGELEKLASLRIRGPPNARPPAPAPKRQSPALPENRLETASPGVKLIKGRSPPPSQPWSPAHSQARRQMPEGQPGMTPRALGPETSARAQDKRRTAMPRIQGERRSPGRSQRRRPSAPEKGFPVAAQEKKTWPWPGPNPAQKAKMPSPRGRALTSSAPGNTSARSTSPAQYIPPARETSAWSTPYPQDSPPGQSQSSTPWGKQRLKAARFKSEPQWDFEENYTLEAKGPQTSCPDSIKAKVTRSPWLRDLFLPNLTLFLDAAHFSQAEWQRLEHFVPPFGFMELNQTLVQEVLAQIPAVPQQQLLLAARTPGGPPCISCAVVGNGGILNDSRVGQEIDGHDYVFRVSGAVIQGYEQDVGTRTSFYGFTAFSLAASFLQLGRRGFRQIPSGKDVHYLHFLEGERDYEWLKALLQDQVLETDNFTWFRQRPRQLFRDAFRLDRYLLLHPDLLRYMKNRFLRSKALEKEFWRLYRPTTGALMLLTALHLCDRVSAYGYITEGHERFSDHYYDEKWQPLLFYINHDFELERQLWKRLHDEGVMRLFQRA
ncbi:alpha-N-acetylgalactosaminide alpha-2,6-sialyltransferase 1 [Tachyglossus aculeatus]|uniref:alpha-N-acetylgalactosaminide alpha-2,6-sialyltransferase 1 n=1 Tax=Tachyglossus aculeatus TaxID=9261 RepID=UPI0018F6BC69|nr:alpha-N-acetylgalactosaminide alpha-2,6-sialyltransferase 1 [Tachyglossus aculeatus]